MIRRSITIAVVISIIVMTTLPVYETIYLLIDYAIIKLFLY